MNDGFRFTISYDPEFAAGATGRWTRTKIAKMVKDVLNAEFRPIYRHRFPADGFQIGEGDFVPDGCKLAIDVIVPRHDEMEQNTELIVPRLIADLIKEFPQLRGVISVVIGPPVQLTAA
jgi:hypothetical protein